jgi:hypothetical protein
MRQMRQMREKQRRRLLLAGVLVLVALAISATTAFGANEPSMAFNPSSWDYGVVAPNTTAPKTFVLTNRKGATGTLTVGLSGSPTFTVTADSCTGTRLAANKSCSVTVQFAPTAAGTHETASLLAVSNKPLLNASVTLVGGVSEGCAVVNDAQFDGFYISAGVNLQFKAGEIVSAHSEEPSTGTTPTQIIIRNASNNLATAAWPGTAQYTIPAAGENSLGWTTDTDAQTTWTVSCAG